MKPLNMQHKAILAHLRANGPATVARVTAAVGLSGTTHARNQLRLLERSGMVTVDRSRKPFTYAVTS